MRITTDCAGAGSTPIRAPDDRLSVIARHSTHSIACSATCRFIGTSVAFSDGSARPTSPL